MTQSPIIISMKYLLLMALLANFFALQNDFAHNLGQGYDQTAAMKFFHYTKVVTCALEDIKAWNCGYYCDLHPGMTEVQAFYNPDHSAQAFCGFNQNENLIVLVYRSTQDITNWVNNIKFFKHEFGDCTNCNVHLGFWETYTDLSNEVQACAGSLRSRHPNAKILIAGHSLGGAVAALTAVDLRKQGHAVDYFFTYGAPRVGTPEFSAWFSQFVNPAQHWRVTHFKDMVVHTPPASFGYLHVPQEVWYNRENTSYQICTSGPEEDPNCANSVWTQSIDDHTTYFNEQQPCRTGFVDPGVKTIL